MTINSTEKALMYVILSDVKSNDFERIPRLIYE